jgi:hypothetical protein
MIELVNWNTEYGIHSTLSAAISSSGVSISDVPGDSLEFTMQEMQEIRGGFAAQMVYRRATRRIFAQTAGCGIMNVWAVLSF